MNIDAVKRESKGKWHGILSRAGAELRTDKKHQPCPICGGKDRFRFDDKDGRGTWFCNQCGAGDGFALYQKITNTDFMEAVKEVSSIVGIVEGPQTTAKNTDPGKYLRQVWINSSPVRGSDLASKYLRSRGLVLAVENLRYCANCYESESKKKIPAMIGVVSDRSGKRVTLHRTYLNGPAKADIKSPKKLMTSKHGSLSSCGAAVRLFPVSDTVGIAEGIETAIACKQLFDIPTWAAISTAIMVGFEPPRGVRKVVIFGDNDANYSGQKAAFTLANKLYNKNYLVEVQIPDCVGDWADHVSRANDTRT